MDELQNRQLFSLLENALYQTPLPSEVVQSLTDEALGQLFVMAKQHDLAHLVSYALFENNLLNKDMVSAKAFLKQQQTAIFRYEQLQFELENICAALEAAQIPYMPLKGSILRAYYPQPWMRTSCDIDVYVDEADLEKAAEIFETQLQYERGNKFACEISYHTPGGVHVELHFHFLDEQVNAAAAARLRELWETSQPIKEGAYQRVATNELFVFYHLIHAAKHFVGGGCGIRPFMDLSIINRYMQYDKQQLNALLEECNLLQFGLMAEEISGVWMEGKPHTQTTLLMQKYLLQGGTYGSLENYVKATLGKKKSKFSYIMSRIFMPYRTLKNFYPKLQKYPILFPFYTLKRWCNLLFVRGRAKRSLQELSELSSAKEDVSVERLFKELELLE